MQFSYGFIRTISGPFTIGSRYGIYIFEAVNQTYVASSPTHIRPFALHEEGYIVISLVSWRIVYISPSCPQQLLVSSPPAGRRRVPVKGRKAWPLGVHSCQCYQHKRWALIRTRFRPIRAPTNWWGTKIEEPFTLEGQVFHSTNSPRKRDPLPLRLEQVCMLEGVSHRNRLSSGWIDDGEWIWFNGLYWLTLIFQYAGHFGNWLSGRSWVTYSPNIQGHLPAAFVAKKTDDCLNDVNLM